MRQPITTLYFTRHGETDYNRAGIVQGRGVNSPLNHTGIQQAEALHERLSSVCFDAIYASPLLRAQQTAEAVARSHPHLKIRFMRDLEEISWGIWEGQKPPAKSSIFRDLLESWTRGGLSERFEGGESALEVHERAQRAIRNISQQHIGQTVLIVTHGRFLRICLAGLLNPDHGLRRMEDIKHTNASLHVLTWDGERYEAALLNDTFHLRNTGFINL